MPVERQQSQAIDPPGPGGGFRRVAARDNFYQTAAFLPMSFTLVTTRNDVGETGIGPHALCFPFSVSPPYAMYLISRGNSGTAINLQRSGRCALNYVEFDRRSLGAIATLGYPGQDAETKRRANPFTLVESPTSSAGEDRPMIIAEAFQVIECSWDRNVPLGDLTEREHEIGASRFVLRVETILLREKFAEGCMAGSVFPNMPIFFGFRSRGEFWFAEHSAPFPVAAPAPPGSELQAVKYLATRLDERIRFTDDACQQLARVPRPFLSTAMQRLIAAAREQRRIEIDAAFVQEQRRRDTDVDEKASRIPASPRFTQRNGEDA